MKSNYYFQYDELLHSSISRRPRYTICAVYHSACSQGLQNRVVQGTGMSKFVQVIAGTRGAKRRGWNLLW